MLLNKEFLVQITSCTGINCISVRLIPSLIFRTSVQIVLELVLKIEELV